jgi:hypothetical protein
MKILSTAGLAQVEGSSSRSYSVSNKIEELFFGEKGKGMRSKKSVPIYKDFVDYRECVYRKYTVENKMHFAILFRSFPCRI